MNQLLDRQRTKLEQAAKNLKEKLFFVLVYDTQGVEGVMTTLAARVIPTNEVHDGIARFRLSDYLPTGKLLVNRIQEAVKSSDWIFLYTGCSHCPERVFELYSHISHQSFESPTFVVVAEQTDLGCANEYMQSLFSIGPLIDLTIN